MGNQRDDDHYRDVVHDAKWRVGTTQAEDGWVEEHQRTNGEHFGLNGPGTSASTLCPSCAFNQAEDQYIEGLIQVRYPSIGGILIRAASERAALYEAREAAGIGTDKIDLADPEVQERLLSLLDTSPIGGDMAIRDRTYFAASNEVVHVMARAVMDRGNTSAASMGAYLEDTEEAFFDEVVGPAIDALERRVRLYAGGKDAYGRPRPEHHYHADTGDLPWPGTAAADCHNP